MSNSSKSSTSEQLFLKRLQSAYTIVVLTGAGMSAPSGVPTFRGKEGLWKKFSPQELANPEAFLKNPELVWEWYRWRRELMQTVKPNLGHYALVDMGAFIPEFNIVTQNVDNLHQVAGTENVTELHGNILRNRCIDCNSFVPESEIDFNGKAVPKCKKCRGLIRPDVVWFGEMLPEAALAKAQQLSAEAEIFIAIGTSATVEPAASLPFLAKGNGAFLLEINTEETPLSAVADHRLPYSVEKVLPVLAMQIAKIRKRVR